MNNFFLYEIIKTALNEIIGPERHATVSGIRVKIKSMRIFVTDHDHNMKEEKRIPVVNGIARFTLAKTSFISLFTD